MLRSSCHVDGVHRSRRRDFLASERLHVRMDRRDPAINCFHRYSPRGTHGDHDSYFGYSIIYNTRAGVRCWRARLQRVRAYEARTMSPAAGKVVALLVLGHCRARGSNDGLVLEKGFGVSHLRGYEGGWRVIIGFDIPRSRRPDQSRSPDIRPCRSRTTKLARSTIV